MKTYCFTIFASVCVLPLSASLVLADPLDACKQKRLKQKVDCMYDAIKTNYVYVGKSIRLNNETGPRNGCLAANNPVEPAGVNLIPMPCNRDPRQYWKIESVPN
jgi:hypothetical protein